MSNAQPVEAPIETDPNDKCMKCGAESEYVGHGVRGDSGVYDEPRCAECYFKSKNGR